jgi:hypothetical protein
VALLILYFVPPKSSKICPSTPIIGTILSIGLSKYISCWAQEEIFSKNSINFSVGSNSFLSFSSKAFKFIFPCFLSRNLTYFPCRALNLMKNTLNTRINFGLKSISDVVMQLAMKCKARGNSYGKRGSDSPCVSSKYRTSKANKWSVLELSVIKSSVSNRAETLNSGLTIKALV